MKPREIVEKVASLVRDGERIGAAVSGGEDSMVLLDAVSRAAEKKTFSFFAVNVEHGIRGESSLSDSGFVSAYCEERGIGCRSFPVNAPAYSAENGLTLEEGARKLRYGVFDSLLKSGDCDRIFLAHHASDQAETVLMRIIRGTGISGLAGMREVSGGYVRPLLSVAKEDIAAYRRERNVPFVTDETNGDNRFTRNYIRNEIMPRLERISPDAANALLRLSRLAAENEDFLSSLDGEPSSGDGGLSWSVPIADGENRLLFKRMAKRCFSALGVEQDVEERHLELLCGLLDLRNGASLDMPFGVTAHREYDRVTFARKQPETDITVPFSIGKVPFGNRTLVVRPYDGVPLRPGELLFDPDLVPPGSVFRTRRTGDVFTKFGGGTKSLGDYLTDRKVPLRIRGEIPVLASGRDVLIVTGIEISDKVKVAEDRKKSACVLTAEE